MQQRDRMIRTAHINSITGFQRDLVLAVKASLRILCMQQADLDFTITADRNRPVT